MILTACTAALSILLTGATYDLAGGYAAIIMGFVTTASTLMVHCSQEDAASSDDSVG